MRSAALIITVSLAVATCSAPADWPQFLGPTRSGVASPGQNLARSWPDGGPEVLWTLDLGPGFGGAAVRDGKVYLLDRVGNEQDALRCLEFATGREVWRFAYEAPGKLGYNGSRSTPTVDDKYIYTVGPFGHFHCVDRATHKPVWTKNLMTDFAGKRPHWGYSQSPLLYKNAVIVVPGSKTASLAAYDKVTGKPLWQSGPMGAPSYASLALMTVDGVDQIVVFTDGGARIAAVEAATGKRLWTYRGWKCNIPIPSPTVLSDGRLFVTGGYKAGSAMLKVARKGDGFAVTELFRLDDLGSLLHNALLYKDHLYVNCNTKRTNDGLVCVSLDGKVKWKTNRSPNMERGNLLLADGLILMMDGKTGVLRLIEPDPAGFKELGQTQVLSRRPIWAPMSLSGGKLLCRDQGQMKCLNLSAR